MSRDPAPGAGIVPVVGSDVLDLARQQGRALARDRAWQISLDAWRVRGTTAERLGPEAVAWDRFATGVRLTELAQRAYAGLGEEDRAFQQAFTTGVNEVLDGARTAEFDTLGIRGSGDWEPWLPGGIFLLNQVLFSSFPTKLWRRHAARAVVEDVVALFHTEQDAGSNAWAVTGRRTASGLPLLAGDPHRLFEAPNCYQQVHLVCPGIDVTGFTFAGVPGVQHFAHTGTVAWGITNAMADYQDLVLEPAPDEPVVTVGPERLGLRTPSWVLGDLGLGALLPLLRARTVDDVLGAFEHWVEPVNQLLVADTSGRVVRRVVGRVPARTDDRARWYPVADPGWTGWVDLPTDEVTEVAGVAVTANQRLPGSEAYGVEFAASYRADRITTLLGDRTGLTAADVTTISADVARPPTVLAGLVAEIVGEVDDATYAGITDGVVAALAALPVFAPLAALDGGFYAPWFALPGRIAQALDRLLGGGPGVESGVELGVDVRALVRDAAARAEPRTRRYFAGHGLAAHQQAVPSPPVPGEPDSVWSSTPVAGTDLVVRGPVARYVWDLADRSSGGWVVPLGASGALDHPHGTDQLPLWLAGDLVALPPFPSPDQENR